MNALDLSPFFQTKAQASDFSARLAGVAEKIFETDFNLDSALVDQFGIKKKDALMGILRDSKVSLDSNTSLKQFLTKLQEDIKSLPIMTITVAFEPKEKHMRKFSEWFLFNLNHQVLFDIVVDSHLIAGATISYKGKTTDFSIREKFEKVLNEHMGKQTPKEEKQHEQNTTS